MSSMAQRRTAAAAAITMLFAALQFVLLTVNPLPAGADHTAAYTSGNPSAECGVDDPYFKKFQFNEGTGDFDLVNAEGDADVSITWTENTFRWTNNETDYEIYRIVLKTGQAFPDVVFDHGEFDPIPNPIGLRQGLSHVTFCLDDKPPAPPGDADVSVSYGCDDKDDYIVTYSVSDASIEWTVDGQPATVTSGQVFAPGTEVSWVATADEGFEFDEGDDVSGQFTAEDCSEPQPGDADVSVSYGCDASDNYIVTFSVSDASIEWTVDGQPATVTSGQVFAPGTEVSWVATADEGFEFDEGDDVSGEFTAEDCSEPQPGDADVSVSYGCDASDNYIVTFSVSDATIAWTVDGQPATVTSGQVFAPGTEVSWVATADEGFEFDEGDDVSGEFTAEECDDTPPPTSPPPTSPPTGSIIIQKLAPQADAGDTFNFTRDFGETGFALGAGMSDTVTGLAAGEYLVVEHLGEGWVLTGLACLDPSSDSTIDLDTRTATVDLSAGETVTCTFTNAPLEVGGIQIESTTTTIAPVTTDTLPFTGFETEELLVLGLVVMTAGGLLLFAASRREEDVVATETIGRWSID